MVLNGVSDNVNILTFGTQNPTFCLQKKKKSRTFLFFMSNLDSVEQRGTARKFGNCWKMYPQEFQTSPASPATPGRSKTTSRWNLQDIRPPRKIPVYLDHQVIFKNSNYTWAIFWNESFDRDTFFSIFFSYFYINKCSKWHRWPWDPFVNIFTLKWRF